MAVRVSVYYSNSTIIAVQLSSIASTVSFCEPPFITNTETSKYNLSYTLVTDKSYSWTNSNLLSYPEVGGRLFLQNDGITLPK